MSSTGSLTASTSYDVWGKPETPGGLTSYTPIGFAGGYTDPTGLVYLINRYYDPTTGMFFTVDPDVNQTGQPYAYAEDDPVDLTDPMGLFCFSFHCLVSDVSHVLSAVSAAAGIAAVFTAAIPFVGEALQGVSDVAGLGATAADLANCATGDCNPTQLALDVLALVPGAAADELIHDAGGLQKAADDLVKTGEGQKLAQELEDTASFKLFELKLLQVNSAGLSTASAVYGTVSSANAATVWSAAGGTGDC